MEPKQLKVHIGKGFWKKHLVPCVGERRNANVLLPSWRMSLHYLPNALMHIKKSSMAEQTSKMVATSTVAKSETTNVRNKLPARGLPVAPICDAPRMNVTKYAGPRQIANGMSNPLS